MKASATNSLTSGPHTEIDDISYHDVVEAENWGARARRALVSAPRRNELVSIRRLTRSLPLSRPFGLPVYVVRSPASES